MNKINVSCISFVTDCGIRLFRSALSVFLVLVILFSTVPAYAAGSKTDIQSQLDDISSSSDCLHFESIKANKDCTKFTIVVNDANTRSESELAVPEQLFEIAQDYAAANGKTITKITINYTNKKGDILVSEEYPDIITQFLSGTMTNNSSSGSNKKSSSSTKSKSSSASTAKSNSTSASTTKRNSNDSMTVWIPTHGGKRYHIDKSCSGMINPAEVTIGEAKALGFSACGRCKPPA